MNRRVLFRSLAGLGIAAIAAPALLLEASKPKAIARPDLQANWFDEFSIDANGIYHDDAVISETRLGSYYIGGHGEYDYAAELAHTSRFLGTP